MHACIQGTSFFTSYAVSRCDFLIYMAPRGGFRDKQTMSKITIKREL